MLKLTFTCFFVGCPAFKNEAEGAEDDLQVSGLA